MKFLTLALQWELSSSHDCYAFILCALWSWLTEKIVLKVWYFL